MNSIPAAASRFRSLLVDRVIAAAGISLPHTEIREQTGEQAGVRDGQQWLIATKPRPIKQPLRMTVVPWPEDGGGEGGRLLRKAGVGSSQH